jgi:hypothetical protein
MLRNLVILFLFGSFSVEAAVNTAPMVLDEDIVLDDEVIEGSTETESYILSAADEAFLKLDDEILLAEAREAKYQAFRDRDMSLDVYHEILDAFEDITEEVEFDAEDEDFLNAGIKLSEGKKAAKASIDSVKSQKK